MIRPADKVDPGLEQRSQGTAFFSISHGEASFRISGGQVYLLVCLFGRGVNLIEKPPIRKVCFLSFFPSAKSLVDGDQVDLGEEGGILSE